MNDGWMKELINFGRYKVVGAYLKVQFRNMPKENEENLPSIVLMTSHEGG